MKCIVCASISLGAAKYDEVSAEGEYGVPVRDAPFVVNGMSVCRLRSHIKAAADPDKGFLTLVVQGEF